MATHPSILPWRIPWTEKPGGLQSMGSQRVRHNGVLTHTHILDYFQQNYSIAQTVFLLIFFFSITMIQRKACIVTISLSMLAWKNEHNIILTIATVKLNNTLQEFGKKILLLTELFTIIFWKKQIVSLLRWHIYHKQKTEVIILS